MYKRDELKALKRDFWLAFSNYCDSVPMLSRRKTHFMLYNTRLKGVELKFDATREGAFVILEVNHPNAIRCNEMFEQFKAYRVVMEEYFPEGLIWQPNYIRPEGKRVHRICRIKEELDIHNQAQWPEFFSFMATEMIQLERAFLAVKEVIS